MMVYSDNVQKISGRLHQLMDARGEYLENYGCVDGWQKFNQGKLSMSRICLIHLLYN